MDSAKIFTNRKMLFISAVFCCLLWGSAYPGVKNGYLLFHIAPDDIPSKMVFAGYRFALAGAIVLALAIASKRKAFSLNKRNILEITLLGLTQTTLQYIFFYIGLSYTTGVKGSIMNATGTFFSVIIAHFLYRNDKLNTNKIAGCLIGFAGVMIVNFSKDLLNFSFSFKGEGAVIFSAFILSVASIYGKKITQTLDSMVVTGYQLLIGGLFLILIGAVNHGAISGFTLKSTALLLYLAVLSSIAFSLWTVLLKYNKVGEVTVFNFLIPVFGAFLSAIFLNESILEYKNAAALVLVSAGIWLVNRTANKDLIKMKRCNS
ncbi:MAG: DMT family transporter [Clostridia bacterium]|nr:DMT family transporter [Clostridia bacterium]